MSTATTHIESEKLLVPALRFNEYEGDYIITNVNECIKFLTDYHANGSYERLKENVELLEKEDYALMIRTTNFEKKDFQNNLLYISEHAYNYLKKSKVLGDDIIINKIANAGATYIMPHLNRPVSLAMNLFMLRVNSNNSGKYIYYKIKTKEFRLRALSSGTGTKTITKQDVKTFKIEIPTLPEQQKIASFLSALDAKIQQLTKKKALLEQYKKGVMQQLFSSQLRFKDESGNPYPDWEEKKFGDLYSFHFTNSLSRDKLNYESGTVYNIHYGDIHKKFKTAFILMEELIPFVNGVVDLSKIKPESYCKNGDLVMADASEDYADIGKTIELIDLNDEKVLAGLHTFLARPTTSETAIGFFSFLLKSWSIRKQIMVIAQGLKVLSLSTGRVGKLKLRLPVIEEQQKIANYLSSIDTKIESVTNQIIQTQTFKKGLLQQMFV